MSEAAAPLCSAGPGCAVILWMNDAPLCENAV